jgi:predicted transcriptional regulator
MKDRRDRMLLFYTLLTHLDEARTSSGECTHHFLEHRMRSNWRVVEHLLAGAMANGWVEVDDRRRVYRITERGREFRVLLERAIAPIYVDYLDRRS